MPKNNISHITHKEQRQAIRVYLEQPVAIAMSFKKVKSNFLLQLFRSSRTSSRNLSIDNSFF